MNWYILLLFICALFLYLYTKYYRLKLETNIEIVETFENELKLSSTENLYKTYDLKINYLSANDAKTIFTQSNQYLKNMNMSNLVARGCNTFPELYEQYSNALVDISQNEQDTINSFILDLLESLNDDDTIVFRNYIVYWMKQITFAKGKSWLESGMPHTIENTIIMDSDWFLHPRKDTLLHEITHVHQRKFFHDFEDLYSKLGYVYYPNYIKGLEPYYQLNRNNPDGTSPLWLWYNNKNNNENNTDTSSSNYYWWIGAIFKTANPDNVADVNYIAVKLDKGADGTFYNFGKQPIKLSKFKEFNEYFGINNNNYHPNETTAKYMEIYLNDKLKSPNRLTYYNYKGYIEFKTYFDTLIHNFYSTL